MIRFSAALVAVAIGVLIGGIATSKLLLVYIAIVVSAVALLALAIGVVVKREELFGEGQGLVPAGAGAAPGVSARTAESQDQPRPVASVPSAAPFQGLAAGYGSPFDGTAFDGTVQAAAPLGAAPPPSAANPSAPYQAPDGQGRDRVADPVPSWEAQSARDQWSPSPLPGSPTAGPAPDWMPSGRGASDPVGQAGVTAPSPPSAMSVSSSGPFSAGPEPASPNWFAPQARPPMPPRPPRKRQPRKRQPRKHHADAAPADEDDDWPARYSWLDDEADESIDETGQSGAPAGQAAGVDAGDHSGPKGSAQEPGGAEPGSAELEPGSVELQPVPADSEPPSADAQDPVPADDLVSVLRGVPRYHQPDCVLIRFMPEGDVQRLPAAQAKADGCTPCAACEPIP